MRIIFDEKSLKPARHFIKHLCVASKVYIKRNKASEDVHNHLHRMRKSIIRMSLTYSEIDRLKRKVDELIEYERQFARLFKPDDMEQIKLKEHIAALSNAIKSEREDKEKIISDHGEKIRELTESLDSIKNQVRHLVMEKAKRQHRLNSLETRIRNKVNIANYYTS